MQVKQQLIFLLSSTALLLLICVNVQASERVCLACEDVQHAATLAALEKRLLQSSPQAVEVLDEQAREWFAKFQEGGMMFDGWKEISDDLVQQVPEEEKLKTKVTLQALGTRIGCEWSKENDVRKISTDMLKKWAKELRKTVAEEPVKIPILLANIESEVDSLLL